MASVYTGYGVSRNRAVRVQARPQQRRAAADTSARIKLAILALVILTACVFLISNLVSSAHAKADLAKSLAEQTSMLNRINSVKFEIQREILPDNLTFNAQKKLGMIRAGDNGSMRLTASSD